MLMTKDVNAEILTLKVHWFIGVISCWMPIIIWEYLKYVSHVQIVSIYFYEFIEFSTKLILFKLSLLLQNKLNSILTQNHFSPSFCSSVTKKLSQKYIQRPFAWKVTLWLMFWLLIKLQNSLLLLLTQI